MNSTAQSSPKRTESTDGRTARRDRGRIAVLEAALELFEEENLEPNPEQIAARAGVSTRSVYRYFEDREQLVQAVIAHKQDQVIPLFRIEDVGQGDLALRLERFAEVRLKVYDAIGASARATAIRAASDPVIAEFVEYRKREFRLQVARHFDIELSRMDEERRMLALNAIDALTQIESIDRFRRQLGLSAEECHVLLTSSVRALLAAD